MDKLSNLELICNTNIVKRQVNSIPETFRYVVAAKMIKPEFWLQAINKGWLVIDKHEASRFHVDPSRGMVFWAGEFISELEDPQNQYLAKVIITGVYPKIHVQQEIGFVNTKLCQNLAETIIEVAGLVTVQKLPEYFKLIEDNNNAIGDNGTVDFKRLIID